MGKIIKNADDCHDNELVKREHHLTRFVVCNAPMMPRKTLIKYYVKIQDIYKRLGNTKKVFDFQELINEAKDPRKYLDMIEPEYEARCEHFVGDDKTINTIHQNLINVCNELGLTDKATYYKTRLIEWLERK